MAHALSLLSWLITSFREYCRVINYALQDTSDVSFFAPILRNRHDGYPRGDSEEALFPRYFCALFEKSEYSKEFESMKITCKTNTKQNKWENIHHVYQYRNLWIPST